MSNLELEEYLENTLLTNPFALRKNFPDKAHMTDFSQIIDKNSYQVISHIYSQISLTFSGKSLKIANYLCQFLDQYGYFKGEKTQISANLNIEENYISDILNRLKTLTPFGIFSENLEEFLLLQLKEQNILDKAYLQIIGNLNLVAKANFTELAKISKITVEEVIKRIKIIKKLEPRPADISQEEQIAPIIADLKLNVINEDVTVELIGDHSSSIYFNKEYYQLIKKQAKTPSEKLYISNSYQEFFNLLRSVKNRSHSLLSIVQKIVEYQKDFFLKGPKYLKPLTINLISSDLGYHPSTISRALKDKYIETPRGYFNLKYFFNKAVDSNGKFANIEESSSKYIQLKIKELVEREDKDKPLSDESIKNIIGQNGHEISRRTIVKYRKILGIVNSSERKKRKILEKI